MHSRRQNSEKAEEEIEAARKGFMEAQSAFRLTGRFAKEPTFRYAKALRKSGQREDWILGISLIKDLLLSEHENREALLMVKAQLHCLSGQYRKSRKELEKILRSKPEDAQAKALHARVLKRVEKDGTKFYVSCVLMTGLALITASWWLKEKENGCSKMSSNLSARNVELLKRPVVGIPRNSKYAHIIHGEYFKS